ncbi:hypothetical protein BGZ76_001738 [Entomortierella beljakovae]|nr:hypothetical protein BGZ76_001738 [Entomortierella beljakovae]
MNSDLRALLLELGFSLTQARAAVAAGNDSVESATEWIFENTSNITSAPVSSSNTHDGTTLRLRHENQDFETDTQRAIDESNRQLAYKSESPVSPSSPKKIKINIIRGPNADKDTTPLLPLTSRHNENEQLAMNTTKVTEAAKRAEKLRKEKMEARLAHQRALEDLRQDKENRKLKGQHKSVSTSSSSSADAVPTNSLPSANNLISVGASASTKSQTTMVQIRLKNGVVLKRSFESTSILGGLFELVRSEDGNIGSADISLIQTPIPAPQPINPGSRLSVDVEMEEPPNEQIQGSTDDLTGEGHTGDGGDIDQDILVDDEDEEIEDNSEDGSEDEEEQVGNGDMMHALPMPFQPPPNRFGIVRVPFSGAGHSLGSRSSSESNDQPAASENSDSVDADAIRRQRVLEAMASRAANMTSGTVKKTESRQVKPKERVIPTLQSLCCYKVAVMLTSSDSKSSKELKLLGENLGSQAAEGIIQELIKLNQLDQLSFKKLHRCSIINLILDAYPRATDSLMDTIGISQSKSLTYLSLKKCDVLTDNGLSNISRFDELEFLDLSHCRVTDKSLEFILGLQYLSTLHLSKTKITSGGLAKAVSKAVWKSSLQTLDVSFCTGITGAFILVNLQELVNIRSLKLNNTHAFNESPVRIPDSRAFNKLKDFDIAWTQITNDDLIYLAPSLKALESINTSSCHNITSKALEHIARDLGRLKIIFFPNREHDLLRVLPIAAALPLTQLDLTDFLHVTDEAILALSSAVNLELLSLAGTKLTDAGSIVFAHMLSLKELSCDRTRIGDKTMEYLRDLGRLEVLALSRCERLTTAGVLRLGRCAFFSMKLKRLNLGNNKFIHDEALGVFQKCHQLVALNLDHTDVTQEKAILLQASLPALKQLRIQGITNGAVYEENPRPVFV